MALDVRQIRCFIKVAESLHFARAADQLHIAQSALSRQIQALEKSLGVRLLYRNKRAPIRLTDAGEMFLAEVQPGLAQLERAESVARQIGRGESGRLEIAYIASATYSGLLPSVIYAYHLEFPAVTVTLLEMETWRQLEALSENRIDVGFLRPRPEYPPGIVVVPQLRETLSIALRVDHPLAATGKAIRPMDLTNESFILPQSDDRAGFGEHTREIGRYGGFSPKFSYNVRDFITALNFVAMGLGISVVPASLRRIQLADVVYRPLDGLTLHAEIVSAVRRNNNSPAVREFINGLRKREQVLLASRE
ncbi:LysR family transcriptional regulator [Shumkonia mesophila]|uniref:LysR family transcriptional regulator n=1 Tax=Shumkonia mesophila TaxID=2838854 RepID=UPI002934DAA2|nr:LysR substrate-binding domain-containing protein [Shumkonia mesophila]